MTVEALTLTTTDLVEIEAELAGADGEARAAFVLCHPHPRYGGTMRSLVISALFGQLPGHGVTCLRFNFRGVEGSGGDHEYGDGERLDARAAIDELESRIPPGVPLVLAGWSFGADVALSVEDPRLAAWFAIACPLASVRDLDRTAVDPRPKVLALAGHDEVRAAADVQAEVAAWTNTTVEVVPGASHFFMGATDRLVALALDVVTRLGR